MKKLLVIISTLFTMQGFGQNIAVTYSTPTGLSPDVFQLPLGNSLFFAYSSQGLVIQKNNLNGQPATIKRYANESIGIKNLISKNGLLYLIGTKTVASSNNASLPALVVLDSASMNIQFSCTYVLTFPNISWVDIFDSKQLNSGNIVMAGAIHTFSTNNTIAWAMEVNPSANGLALNTNTLSVGTSTANSFVSVVETSNSTLLFSGTSSSQGGFLSKATRSSGSLTFSTVYPTSAGGGTLNKYSNQKKVIISKYLNSGSDAIIKLDTNLGMLSTASQAGIIRIGGNFNGADRIKVVNNTIYRANGKTLDILDSALTTVATKSYTTINPMNINNLNITNSNVFMLGYTMYDIMGLLKTDLSGNLGCSNAITFSNSLFQTNGGPTTFVSGAIGATQSFTTTSSVTSTVLQTVTCGNITTEIGKNSITSNNFVVCYNGNCVVKSNSTIQSIQLYDLTGKLVKHVNYLNNETDAKVKVEDLTMGIYLVRVIGVDKSETAHKILVN